MTKIIYGDRIGKLAVLRPSSCAVIFDSAGEKVLITRRSDNGQWCLPGGGMDPGESAEETCAREVLEETGLVVEIVRLIGVYSNPHRIIEYADGNRFQGVTMSFEAKPIGGELRLTDETTAFGYFTMDEMKLMDLMGANVQRVADAFARQEAAFLG
ncbi:MAG: NUDIX domain-containing protein [Chloroflexi bacterium]|nr:NUDIX domain-containing protein [Chloroflexota bacterium]